MSDKSFFSRLLGDSTATFVGFVFTCGVLLISVWLTDRNARRLADANDEVDRTHRVTNGLERLLSTLKDAETGSRGFVITGNPTFLQPYDDAVERIWGEFGEVQQLTSDDPLQQVRLENVRQRIERKLTVTKEVIELRRTDEKAAEDAVSSGRGKTAMEAVRKTMVEMQAEEQRLRGIRSARAQEAFQQSVAISLVTGAAGVLMLVAVFWLIRRHDRNQLRASERLAEQKERLRTTLASIGDAVISTDCNGDVTYLNAVAESLTGWTDADAVGVPLTQVFRIVNESTRQAVENPAIRALKEGIIVGSANHTMLIAKDGSERPIDDSAAPIRCKNGEIVGCVLVFRDVSERHRQEQELQRSNAILRAVSDGTPDLIFVKDRDGRMLLANPATLRVIGLTEREVLGTTELDRPTAPGEAEAIMANDRRIMNVGATEFLEETYSGPIGTRVYQAVKSPMRDAAGTVVGLIGVLRDITEQKRDSEQLRRSEERLRRVFDAQSVGMIEWDLERSTITAANEHFLNMVGYTAADIVAGRLDFRAMTPPEWTPRNEAGIAEMRESGRANAYEKEYFRKDGSRVPILIAGIRFEDSDRAGMSFIVDLSDRKRAEKELRESEIRFRAMAENIQQLAWMAHADGYIYWYNRRWYDYTGTRPDTQEGWGWESVHDPEVLPKVVERWKLSIATGEPFDMIFPLKGSDGIFRPFLTRVMPVRDAEGRVVQWFGTNTDITEQRALEENLRNITAELSEADRRKDEFLATLAHELRNPLAPIRNGLQILRIADDTATIERVRTMMERQLAQMVHLVDDLLDVSRISRGKLQLRKERIELATVLNDAIETSRPIIDAGGHTLVVTLPPEPITLDADATRLGQIFSNLLNNAAKYSERGGLISVVTMKDEGGRLKVTITDTGVGIPPEMLPRIFEMFTQVDRSLEKSQGGLGIGLTLVKRLVEMHDGTIEARSEGHGKGSEFIVRLPIASKEKPMAIPRHDTQQTPRVTALKVLVADDNEDSAMTLSMILKILGSEVRTANDGMEAVEVATAFRPDVILLDIGMPRLNGYEACRRIREQPWGEKIVLVALTGWGQDEDKRRSQEAGFTHHMVKPIDPDALKKLLFS